MGGGAVTRSPSPFAELPGKGDRYFDLRRGRFVYQRRHSIRRHDARGVKGPLVSIAASNPSAIEDVAHALCTHFARTLHALCTHFARTLHALCTHFARTLRAVSRLD